MELELKKASAAPMVQLESADEPKQVVEAAKIMEAKKKRAKTIGIYNTVLVTQRIPIPIVYIGDNIKQTLEKTIAFEIEGKCIVEGYVKPQSCSVVSYSCGELSGSDAMFIVIVECEVCCPVEGMHIACVAKNITESAGIKAKTEDSPSPVVIYLARDHHFKNTEFSKIKVGDKINVRVIGQRFELNDEYISVIAELIENKDVKYGKTPLKKLVISTEKID